MPATSDRPEKATEVVLNDETRLTGFLLEADLNRVTLEVHRVYVPKKAAQAQGNRRYPTGQMSLRRIYLTNGSELIARIVEQEGIVVLYDNPNIKNGFGLARDKIDKIEIVPRMAVELKTDFAVDGQIIEEKETGWDLANLGGNSIVYIPRKHITDLHESSRKSSELVVWSISGSYFTKKKGPVKAPSTPAKPKEYEYKYGLIGVGPTWLNITGELSSTFQSGFSARAHYSYPLSLPYLADFTIDRPGLTFLGVEYGYISLRNDSFLLSSHQLLATLDHFVSLNKGHYLTIGFAAGLPETGSFNFGYGYNFGRLWLRAAYRYIVSNELTKLEELDTAFKNLGVLKAHMYSLEVMFGY